MGCPQEFPECNVTEISTSPTTCISLSFELILSCSESSFLGLMQFQEPEQTKVRCFRLTFIQTLMNGGSSSKYTYLSWRCVRFWKCAHQGVLFDFFSSFVCNGQLSVVKTGDLVRDFFP
ncbi:hypothetical protein AVEN_214956-1 [Araneus ventricosus]|uniref:Uncharacterized protein n=1 Tax=Araneus ventricosus TaxID=182803 RepID=A0A4Y2D976_ARAVE|nr:hypothetical protein AVEN_214956-1 [Araneus ventricosus]